jgi:hypothetical protein
MITAKIITEDDWEETYKPTINHIDENASWNSMMFETYGEEVEFVRAQPYENVWTYVDGDEGTYLVNGYGFVNRIGYFVCEVPWVYGEFIEIVLD